MKKYITVRVIKAALTILFVWCLVFFLARLTGDPVEWMLSNTATLAAKEQLRHNLGLDLPLWEQFWRATTGIFRGDAGNSYYYVRPVIDLFAERIRATLSLGGLVFCVSILVGVPLGVIAAVKHNSPLDRAIMGVAVAGYTIPNFVFGILLIFIFSLNLRLLPSGNYGTPAHYILPVISMAVGPTASISRITRSALLDVIRQDYLDCARAKGVREWVVILKHALRNALIPVITVSGMGFCNLLGGMVFVEKIFSWPGIGQYAYLSATTLDFPAICGVSLLIAVTYVVVNLLIDILYGVIYPRIRYQ